MNIEASKLGSTQIMRAYPWGINIRKGSRVMCGDGKIRSLASLGKTSDTFFSIPAAIRYKGRHVTGYVTTEKQRWIDGQDFENNNPKKCWSFRPHTECVEKFGFTELQWPGHDTYGEGDDLAHQYNAIIRRAHE